MLLVGVLLAVAANVATLFLINSFRADVSDLAQRQLKERQMPEVGEVAIAEASWRSGGILIVVKTPRETGQTAAEWAAAHKANVDAMLVQFPKDP